MTICEHGRYSCFPVWTYVVFMLIYSTQNTPCIHAASLTQSINSVAVLHGNPKPAQFQSLDNTVVSRHDAIEARICRNNDYQHERDIHTRAPINATQFQIVSMHAAGSGSEVASVQWHCQEVPTSLNITRASEWDVIHIACGADTVRSIPHVHLPTSFTFSVIVYVLACVFFICDDV
jgi:hypothetical protein